MKPKWGIWTILAWVIFTSRTSSIAEGFRVAATELDETFTSGFSDTTGSFCIAAAEPVETFTSGVSAITSGMSAQMAHTANRTTHAVLKVSIEPFM
jgi:hypothetical protein